MSAAGRLPALTVVLPSMRGSVAAAVESVGVAARRAGAPVQVVVAWQSAGPPPALPDGVEIVTVLPVGVSAARNAGLARARGDVVAFVDDDETVETGWVAGTLSAFEDARVDAALGQVLPADDAGIPYCEIRIDARRLMRGRRRAPWDIGTGGNMALRRGTLMALGGFDSRLGVGTPARAGEDTDVIARLQEAGAVIAAWPDMIVRHPTKSVAEVRASRRPYGRGMGVLARRRLSPVLVVHFMGASYWALRAVVTQRSRRRARELAETVHGWVGGVLAADRWNAPVELLAYAPQALRDALGERPLRGLPVARRGDLHFVYAAGADRFLHVRTGDPARRVRGLAVQRELDGHPGVPVVHAAADDGRAQWVLEERLGADGGLASASQAAAWFAALARRATGRVRDGRWWTRQATALPGGAARWSALVAAALERVGDLPSAPAHGDPRRQHLLAGTAGVGVIGWEAAEPDAPAGLDLVALAAGRDGTLAGLLAGGEPGLRAALADAGVPAAAIADLVTVTLAHLVQGERRRAATLGAPPAPAVFAPLLDRLGPVLATRA